MGVITQANNALFHEGPSNLPAVDCFSTDPVLRYDTNRLVEQYVPHRRTSLPTSWTGGAAAYIADIMIERKSLRHKRLVGKPLLCLVHPGKRGLPLLIPHDLVPDAEPGSDLR